MFPIPLCMVRIMVFNTTFNNIFSYIVAVSSIGGGNLSTRIKPPTCRKSLTIFTSITYCSIEYTSPSAVFKPTIFWVIGTDCTGSLHQ